MDIQEPHDSSVANGLELARSMMLHYADGDDAAALFALNVASEGAAKWACAYLVGALREQAKILGRNVRPRRTAADLLRAGASGVNQDIVATQVDDFIERLTGGDRNG